MAKYKTDNLTKEEVLGKQPSQVWLILATIAMLMIVAGTIIPLLQRNVALAQMNPVFRYIYAAGALLLLSCRIFTPYTGKSLRIKRLFKIEAWSAVFFCVAAFFLFYEPSSARDWIAFTLAGGALLIYTSIMIPRAVRKALATAETHR